MPVETVTNLEGVKRHTNSIYIYGDVILASFLYKPIIFENKVA